MKKELIRSSKNTEVTDKQIGEKVTLNGWVHRRRDHGGIIFVDLRDISGVVQCVFDPAYNKDAHQLAEELRNEFVISVTGVVHARSDETINPNMKTGKIEVFIDDITILNRSKALPFMLDEHQQVNEETRLQYRYLDLRRPAMQENFIKRAKISRSVRNYLDENGFIDIETPMLTKSTPEGARDFLVPSRMHGGEFYALPQSPQIFKQILMVSGFDRYYQIVKCFRDEDLRADRQPEFTQIDIEYSFSDMETVIITMEEMFTKMLKEVYDIEINLPIKRITYEESMTKYGNDRPDLRFGLELVDVKDLAARSNFKVFKQAAEGDGVVYAINAKGGGAKFSRKNIDDYTKYVGNFGAKGLAWMKVTENGLESNITKFFPEDVLKEMAERTNAEAGDILFFGADAPQVVYPAMGNLRNKLGEDLGLIDENQMEFVWVVDFPLFEWDDEAKRYIAIHHPFTAPRIEDMDLLESNPLKVKSQAYDLVLNGTELGGGSIRIHQPELQQKVFNLLGISDEEAKEKFGFLIDALSLGAPPHGGIAFGLDRIVMLMQKVQSIRDVIAFPKTQRGQCMMSHSPSAVDRKQLRELSLKVDVKK